MVTKLIYLFKRSIVNKFTLLLILIIIIPISLAGIFTYKTVESIIYNNSAQVIQKDLKLLSSNIDSVYNHIITVSNNYFNNKDLQKYLNKDYISYSDLFSDSTHINSDIIMPNSMTIKNINYTFIIGKNGRYFTDFNLSSQLITEKNFIVKIKGLYDNSSKNNNLLEWLNTEKVLLDNHPMLTFTRTLIDNSGNKVGALLLFIDERMLSEIFEKQGYNSENEIMIVNDQGTIISGTDNSKIGVNINNICNDENLCIKNYTVKFIDGEEKLISMSHITNNNWKIINIIPTKYLFEKVNIIRNSIILTVLIVTLLAFIVGELIIRKITRPLHILQNKAIEVSEGNLNIHIDTKGYDEIAKLSICFNEMLQKIRKLIDDIYVKQEELISSEILAYQSQMSPHFLNNTLNNIKWIAISKNENEIADMVSALGSILESSLRNKTGMIRVCEEVKLLEKYIYIQKFRYKDKFEVELIIEEGTKQLYIPSLLIQPIIENAIFHGIGTKKFIKIRLHCKIRDEQLFFEIKDNGSGISDKVIQEIFENKKVDIKHIGLFNIRKRIKLRFGEKYDINIQSYEGEGTNIIINLPIIKECS